MEYLYKNRQNYTEYNEFKFQNHFIDSELTIKTFNNVICIPTGKKFECFLGGSFEENGNPINISFQRDGIKTSKELFNSIDINDINYIDEDVVYLGQARNHWGSFIVDSISRLWAIDKNYKKYVVMITHEELGDLDENIVDFYKHLDIYDKIIFIKKPTKFKKMYFPEMSYIPGVGYHKEFINTIYKVVDDVLINREDLRFEKVYFSRYKFSRKTKNEFGEKLIEKFLSNNGYKTIYPEEHTLDEQIFIVNHCKVLASAGGSCAHNIIFAKTKPKFIIFNRMGDYQWHQWMLNEICDINLDYVDAYVEPFKKVYKTTISGPYLYWINRNVKKFAEDNKYNLCKKIWFLKILEVIKYSIRVAFVAAIKIRRKIK